MKEMHVRFTYDFYLDTGDLDPKFVDIEGMAKDEGFRNLKIDINADLIDSRDFVVIKEE